MSRRFIVRPLAEADLESAAQWYDEERPGLAERFLNDVDRSFVRLRDRPLQFPVVTIRAQDRQAAQRRNRRWGPRHLTLWTLIVAAGSWAQAREVGQRMPAEAIAAAPGDPPGAPGTPRASINGNAVTLAWTAPTGTAPITYVLFARLTAGGAIVATLPVGSATTITVSAPSGIFIVSIQAANGEGAGPESPGVAVSVPGMPSPPGAPELLTADVSGAAILFSWTAAASGGAPGLYTLFASTASGGPVIATLPFNAHAEIGGGIALPVTSFSVTNVPPGTYHVRLRASNLGGTSPASNEVRVTVATSASPAAPTLNAPAIAGRTVSLTWTPASTGGQPAIYIVHAALSPGGAAIASIETTSAALTVTDVPPGQYFVTVRASNAAGASPASNEVAVTVSSAMFPAGTVLSLVSGETNLPVAGAAVVIAGRTYSASAAGAITLAEDAAAGSPLDVAAPGFLDRQTLLRTPAEVRFTLWPRTSPTGLSESFVRETVYSSGLSQTDPTVLGTGPLYRPGPSLLSVYAPPEVQADATANQALVDGAARLSAATDRQVVFAVTNDAQAANIIRVTIDPGIVGAGSDRVCDSNGYIIGGAIIFNQVTAVRNLGTVVHELGHVFGLGHTTARGVMQGPNPGSPTNPYASPQLTDFTEQEKLVMKLMLQRRPRQRWPDNDRGLTQISSCSNTPSHF